MKLQFERMVSLLSLLEEQYGCGSWWWAAQVRGNCFSPGSQQRLLESQSYRKFFIYDLPLPALSKKERLNYFFKENLSLENYAA